MFGRKWIASLFLVALTLGPGVEVSGAPPAPSPDLQPTPAAPPPLEGLLAEHAHPVRVEDGELRGPGARLLADAARGTRFFAMGEAPHLRAALPPFATALFRLLREEAGYRYLALEEGPLIARLVSEAGRRGGRDSVLAVARRYPTAFHMYTLDELHMMGDVAALGGEPVETSGSARATDSPGPVWGLNRVYGGWHVLERLAELATTDRAREAARALAEAARPYEEERFVRNVRWLVEGLEEGELARLEAAFGSSPSDSEAARLLEQLRISRRTFAPYHREDPAPGDFYRSARLREDNMKRLFSRRYREARAAAREPSPGGREGASLAGQPRVMVKLGLYHLSRGRKLVGEVPTLGNFLSELAVFEGSESFHLAAVTDAEEVRGAGIADPFLAAAEPAGGPVLLDLRPLHPLVGSGELGELPATLRRLVLDYDAVVVLPDTGMGTVEPLRTPDFHLSPGG